MHFDFLKRYIPPKAAFLILISALLTAAFFLIPFESEAEGYDIFVDKNYSGTDEDGSEKKPFKNIAKALEEAGTKKNKIYVRNGTYKEQVVLLGKTELYGQDRNKTVIQSDNFSETVMIKGNNKLKNITVSGGRSAVVFYGEGSLEDCLIKNASRKGIDLTEKSGKVEIKDSKITGNGKGIYAQKGRTIVILDSEFSDNTEEGIDIREKVSGTISGNYIAKNGEPGIEIVVGSSDVIIRNNRIEKNKTSGIATQFYASAPKTGQVKITKNTISRNGAYGIRCSAPSGGKIPANYWNDSLDVTDNKIENNVGKAIDRACKLISAITPGEEDSNEKIESETADDPSVQSEIEKEAEEEMRREEEMERQEKEQMRLQTQKTRQKISEKENILAQKNEEILEQSKFRLFLAGSKLSLLDSLKQELENLKNELGALEKLAEEEKDDEIKNELVEFIEGLRPRLAETEDLIRQEEKRFSLFGWLVKLFDK